MNAAAVFDSPNALWLQENERIRWQRNLFSDSRLCPSAVRMAGMLLTRCLRYPRWRMDLLALGAECGVQRAAVYKAWAQLTKYGYVRAVMGYLEIIPPSSLESTSVADSSTSVDSAVHERGLSQIGNAGAACKEKPEREKAKTSYEAKPSKPNPPPKTPSPDATHKPEALALIEQLQQRGVKTNPHKFLLALASIEQLREVLSRGDRDARSPGLYIAILRRLMGTQPKPPGSAKDRGSGFQRSSSLLSALGVRI